MKMGEAGRSNEPLQWKEKINIPLQIYFDNRLTALVKQGLLTRVGDGLYKMNSLYPERRYQNEWAVIRGVTLLPPQEGLSIPQLVKVSPAGIDVKHDTYLPIAKQ